jgi:hypothetical protein
VIVNPAPHRISEKEFKIALRKKSCLGAGFCNQDDVISILDNREVMPISFCIGSLRSRRSFALFIIDCNKSATNTNNRGDNRSSGLDWEGPR